MTISPATHVIFDLGGTLIDFFPPFKSMLKKYAINNGKDIQAELMGERESIKDCLTKYFESINLSDEKLIGDLKEKLAKKLMAINIPLNSGVDRLIKHLHKHNIPMAIATSGNRKEFKLFSIKFGDYYYKYFNHCVCGADDPEVKNNKPFPDVYLVCAKRFKTEPKSLENCVIFEDSMTGITGAVDSGMKTVLINDRRVYSIESIANKITSIANSFDDFRPESVGLPHY